MRWPGGNPTLAHAFLDSLHASGCAGAARRVGAAIPHGLGRRPPGGRRAPLREIPLLRRIRIRLGLGRGLRAPRPRVLPQAARGRALHARHGGAPAGRRRRGCASSSRKALVETARAAPVSSLHVLFPLRRGRRGVAVARDCSSARACSSTGATPGYGTFDDFLGALSHDKRKKIRQERRRVAEAGVALRARSRGARRRAPTGTSSHACYRRTYREHRSTPYLNARVLRACSRARMPDNVLLVIAEREGKPIAAALNLFGGHALYGRYWGATEYVPGLHFEACYYQARGVLHRAGHRALRGRRPGRAQARARFPPRAHPLLPLARASGVQPGRRRVPRGRRANSISAYVDELNERTPFKR